MTKQAAAASTFSLSDALERAASRPGTEALCQLISVADEWGAVWTGIYTAGGSMIMGSEGDWSESPLPKETAVKAALEGQPVEIGVPGGLTLYGWPCANYTIIAIASQYGDPVSVAWKTCAMLLLKHEAMTALLERARIETEKRLVEVATLYETSLAIERSGLESFLSLITERAAQVMDSQACSLMLMEGERLRIAATHGLPAHIVEETSVNLGEGIAGQVATSGEPMMITDPALDPRLKGVKARPDISGSICVPLKDGDGRSFGVLTIRRLHPSPPYSAEDLRLFTVFASQVGLALSNARLHHDLNLRLKELTTLIEMSRIVNSTLDVGTVLNAVADQILSVAGFERCAVFLSSDKGQTLMPVVARGYHESIFPPAGFKRGQSVIGLVAKENKAIIARNARLMPQPMKGFGRQIGADHYVALPITVRGRCIGVVAADHPGSAKPVGEEQLSLLSAFVNQAGAAVENARLFGAMEQRFKENQQMAAFLDNVLRSIGAGVATLDREGRVIEWNRAAEQIARRSAKQAKGMNFRAALCLDNHDGPAVADAIGRSLDKGEPSRLYKQRCEQSGRLTLVDFAINPLIDQSGATLGAVVVFEDVSEQAKMEEQMGLMSRMAEIGQMTATIAHELRNPMTAVRGAAQLLAQEPLSDEAADFLQIITEEVNRLNAIADEFLEFAKPLALSRRRVDLGRLASRTVRIFEPFLTEHGVEARLRLAEKAEVDADPARVEQILQNLIQNATQAMSNGGTITVSTGAKDGFGWFSVQDSGCGIPEAIKEQIFTPFFTTKVQGTGLGLSVVNKIVEAHGGTIALESNEGYGAEITVFLPLAQRAS